MTTTTKTSSRGHTTGNSQASRTASKEAGSPDGRLHTPGPWKVLTGVCRQDHPDTSADVVDASLEVVVADCGCHEAAIANATLIAAAPELLAALKETLAYWTSTGFADCEPDCDCIVESVRAAIAKAEQAS